ncbi:Quaternary ammonium compound-resistance protein SugE [Pandoraea cepalis]|uniref:Guanidinium exporter n=1 Tax=Pandoraea cepalis TaxID=2508294 RepID=A0A5E4RSB8_9BURK|nr:SMR family transporter [Pandoraea cepalis]VVD64959.1 Quaternary ammonium compound-resistance protein SugE [Pandoraea cepalis]
MSWIVLSVAGLLEIAFAFGMKWSVGFSRLWPSVYAAITGLGSIWLLNTSLRSLPVGTAVIGMIFLGESASVARVVCIALILSGVVGLRITAGAIA